MIPVVIYWIRTLNFWKKYYFLPLIDSLEFSLNISPLERSFFSDLFTLQFYCLVAANLFSVEHSSLHVLSQVQVFSQVIVLVLDFKCSYKLPTNLKDYNLRPALSLHGF